MFWPRWLSRPRGYVVAKAKSRRRRLLCMGRKRKQKRPPRGVFPFRFVGLVSGCMNRRGAATADHLSSLPDELLLSVVCHLPVIEAVRMSVLSRRWRRLPRLLPVLDFMRLRNVGPAENEESYDWFEAVNKAMSGRWGLVRVCDFSSTTPLAPGDDQWAEAIGGTGVRELRLRSDDYAECNAYPVLYHCRSLTGLTLSGCFLTSDTRAAGSLNIRCTGLREIQLTDVEISDHLLQRLISTCVCLERLEFDACTGLGSIRILAAVRLKCVVLTFYDTSDFNEVKCSTFEVDTPNLEHLNLQVVPWWFEEIIIHAPKLTSLSICRDPMDGEPELPSDGRVVAEGLRSLMNNVTKLRSLVLCGTLTQLLSLDLAPERFRPSFLSLTTLYLDLSLQDHQQASCLALLLQGCYCLKVLHLFIGQHASCHDDFPCHPLLLFWDYQKMLEKMRCLHHLQEVTLSGLTGEIYETLLARFFLKMPGTLKKLTLDFLNGHTKAMDMVAKHLQDLRRCSAEAELAIISSY